MSGAVPDWQNEGGGGELILRYVLTVGGEYFASFCEKKLMPMTAAE